MPRDVRVAAERMADQDGVVAGLAEAAVSLVADLQARQLAAQLQRKRLVEPRDLRVLKRPGAADAVAAFKFLFGHELALRGYRSPHKSDT